MNDILAAGVEPVPEALERWPKSKPESDDVNIKVAKQIQKWPLRPQVVVIETVNCH
jgi:hypothetical protein